MQVYELLLDIRFKKYKNKYKKSQSWQNWKIILTGTNENEVGNPKFEPINDRIKADQYLKFAKANK